MCGIIGFCGDQPLGREEILSKMNESIVHRGPDSDGAYFDEKMSMGFRRLSIIDLEEGTQPIKNEDGTKVVTMNGEIYNYKELRQELLEQGHVFRTHSDTEVLVHAYEQYGKDMLSKLRGMFAFVIWDSQKQELFGARDFFGIKPFYYTQVGSTLLYGSEIKSFLNFPDFKKELNEEALKPYLVFQYSVLNETFFKNVFKLPPGHCLTFSNGNLKVEQYFAISYAPDQAPPTFEEAVSTLQDTMEDSIRYHQVSDVEVGAFLSGGVDSSYVVTCARPNKCFTVGFDIEGFDETSHAKELAASLGIENISKHITADEFFDAIPKVQYHSDEPHANLSSVPLYYLAQLAASTHTKVVLSGEGADELFAGYNEYEEPPVYKLYAKLPLGLRRGMKKLFKKSPHFRGKTIIMKYGQPVEERYIGQAHIMSDDEANRLLAKPYQRSLLATDLTQPYYDKVANQDDVTKRCYLDMNMWLVNDILLKADKMTMAHSLELRVPFLDKKVWDLASKLPTEYKVNGTTTKHVLRRASADKLPPASANRRKFGFLVPFIHWIKEEKYYNAVKETVLSPTAARFFDTQLLERMLTEHYAGKANHGRKIYTVYAFLVWYNQYFSDAA